MKKIYHYLLLTVLALCLSIPALGAEAASVALLPLINNVAGDTIASQVYFKSALSSINAQQGFVLVDNDQLTAAIESAQLGREVPDQATMAKIAKDGNVDLVIVMQLDVLDDKAIYDGWEVGANVALAKNIVAQIEYMKLDGKFKSDYDDDALWTQVTFTF